MSIGNHFVDQVDTISAPLHLPHLKLHLRAALQDSARNWRRTAFALPSFYLRVASGMLFSHRFLIDLVSGRALSAENLNRPSVFSPLRPARLASKLLVVDWAAGYPSPNRQLDYKTT